MEKALYHINDTLRHKSEVLKCASNLLSNYKKSHRSFINIIFDIVDENEMVDNKDTTMYYLFNNTKKAIDNMKDVLKLDNDEIKELILRGFYKSLNDHDISKVYTDTNYIYNSHGVNKVFLDYNNYVYTSSKEYDLYKDAVYAMKGLEFGTPEYNKIRPILDEGFKLHSKVNPHHPEYYPEQVRDMDLLSFTEMVIDWCAAAIARGFKFKMSSIDNHAKRFNIDDSIINIIKINIELIMPNINLIEYD